MFQTLGDIDPLNKVPFKRAISRVRKGPVYGVSLILPWMFGVTVEAQKLETQYHQPLRVLYGEPQP